MFNINNKNWEKLRYVDIIKFLDEFDDDETFL